SFTRALTLGTIVLLMVAAAACGSAPATATPGSPSIATPTPLAFSRPQNPAVEPTPVGGMNLKGRFVFAMGDGSLYVEDAGGNNPRALFKATQELYADSPVFSPDGKQIAFSASSFTKDGAVLQDVHVMNADGTNMRVVATPAQPKITLGFPAWSPDGKELFITQSYSVPPSSQHDEIDAVSVNGGALRKVIDTAREASISPDGKKMVYSRIDYQTYSSGLWIANIDGSRPQQLLATGVFAAVFGARFSPDGQSIVFAASGPPNKKLPGAYALNRSTYDEACAVSFASVCLVEKAEAHGLPWDLWLVNLDGTKFERLTNIGADSPVPAWSADGKQIAFFDATGIYILDVATKKINQVSDSRGYGGFDWR
ncbi:MAG: PD40 domain-containing protein, partial [Chloroflexota bacterium]|nr:PD40 domain-containing protein [Chloroflexota bacterium]